VLIGGAGADAFVMRSAFGVEVIADFGADDELQLARGINDLGELSIDDVTARIDDLGGDAWLDLGNGNGVMFLGIGADELGAHFDSNLVFI
jgi:hypothetical protein